MPPATPAPVEPHVEILDPLRLATWAPALQCLQPDLRQLFRCQVLAARGLDSRRPPLLELSLTTRTKDGCCHRAQRRLLTHDAEWPIFHGTLEDMMRGLPTTFDGEVELGLTLHDEAGTRARALHVPARIWPPDRPPPSTVPLKHQLAECRRENRWLWKTVARQDRQLKHFFDGAPAVIFACADAIAARGPVRVPADEGTGSSSALQSIAAGVTGEVLDRLGIRHVEQQNSPAPGPGTAGSGRRPPPPTAGPWHRSVVWVAQVEADHGDAAVLFVERTEDECSIWMEADGHHHQLGRCSVDPNRPWRRDPDLVAWVKEAFAQHAHLGVGPEAAEEEGHEEPPTDEVRVEWSWLRELGFWRQGRMATDGETVVWVHLLWDRGRYQLSIHRGAGRPPAVFRRPGPARRPRDPGVRVFAWVDDRLDQAAVAPPADSGGDGGELDANSPDSGEL